MVQREHEINNDRRNGRTTKENNMDEDQGVDFSGWPISEVYKAVSEGLLVLGIDQETREEFHRQMKEEYAEELEELLS